MDCILTGVTILVYVVWCVSLFVSSPSHSKNMTVKSDLKNFRLQKILREELECFLKLKRD